MNEPTLRGTGGIPDRVYARLVTAAVQDGIVTLTEAHVAPEPPAAWMEPAASWIEFQPADGPQLKRRRVSRDVALTLAPLVGAT